MDFDLSDEQRLLKDSVERLLADRYDFETRKRHGSAASPAGAGTCGRATPSSVSWPLPFPPTTAASAAGPVETMIVMEAIGRALALEPYFATVVLSGGVLRHGGSDAQKARAHPQDRRRRALLSPSPRPSRSRATTCSMSPRPRARRRGLGDRRREGRGPRTATAPTGSSSPRAQPAPRATGAASACFWSTPRRPACRGAAMRPRTATAPPRSCSKTSASARRR